MVEGPNNAEFDKLLKLAREDHGVRNLFLQLFNIDLQKKFEDIINEDDRYRVDVLRGQAGVLRWYIEQLGG